MDQNVVSLGASGNLFNKDYFVVPANGSVEKTLNWGLYLFEMSGLYGIYIINDVSPQLLKVAEPSGLASRVSVEYVSGVYDVTIKFTADNDSRGVRIKQII